MKENWVCLIKIKSGGGLRSHLIDKPSFTIGRTKDADLTVVDSSISRIHLIVEVGPNAVSVMDKKSANGTLHNGRPLAPGRVVQVLPGDILNLGSSSDEFSFQSLPMPVELSDLGDRRKVLASSMDELAREIESKAQRRLEEEVSRAQSEVEQAKSQARREIETFKAQASAELQARKAELADQQASQRHSAQAAADEEKVRARREADALISDAQVRIRKDFEESSNRIDAQTRAAHTRCLELVAEADRKAGALLADARDEAARVRLAATEDARRLQQESLQKARDAELALQEKLQRELEEKRADALVKVRIEFEKEQERFSREQMALKESAQSQLRDLDERVKSLRGEVEASERERSKIASEIECRKSDLEFAQKMISETEELKRVRTQVEAELSDLQRQRESRKASIEREMVEAQQKALLAVESQRRDLDVEMGKKRLAALVEIEALVRAEEKKYEQTKKLRSLEITEKMHDRLIPKLEAWLSDPQTASKNLRTDIESVVNDIMIGGSTSIQAVTGVVDSVPTVRQEARDRKLKQRLALAGVSALLLTTIYHRQIFLFFQDVQKESYASKMLERRRIQSIYAPQQTPDFRDNYTDNVLYMSGYFETKTDQDYIEKWTLRLNDLAFLRSMGLSEEDVVKYIAKETNLVQRLGSLRSSIDAVYLSEGIERMRKAEAEDVAEIQKALKGPENFRKIRQLEQEFFRAFKLKSKQPGS